MRFYKHILTLLVLGLMAVATRFLLHHDTGITQNLWASGIVNGKQTLFTTPLTWTAGYDNRNRLTSFARAGASTSYTYDANSNRLTSQDTRTSDTDLDLDFAKPDMSQAKTQALNC